MVGYIKIPLLILSAFLFGCGTSQIIVDSQPEGADVLVKYSDLSVKKLGTTPFKSSENQIGTNGDSYELLVSKEKFSTDKIVIAPSKFPRDVKISSRLNPLADSSQALTFKDLNEVSKITAQAINLIKSKNFGSAERMLLDGINKYPFVPTFFGLLGNCYYLNKDFSKALVAYKKVSDLDPQNFENEVLIKKIETIRGAQ